MSEWNKIPVEERKKWYKRETRMIKNEADSTNNYINVTNTKCMKIIFDLWIPFVAPFFCVLFKYFQKYFGTEFILKTEKWGRSFPLGHSWHNSSSVVNDTQYSTWSPSFLSSLFFRPFKSLNIYNIYRFPHSPLFAFGLPRDRKSWAKVIS